MLSFVGVGPGDLELVTLRAARALEEADEIAIADSGAGESVALRIAARFIEGKPILRLPMPMREGEDWSDAHNRAAAMLIARLESGVRVAYPVLGDPSLYATSSYLCRLIAPLHPCEVIPGVPAMCAAAAALRVPLAEGRETLNVLPGFRKGDALPDGAVVVMKAGRSLSAIRVAAGGRRVLVARNLGLPDEYLGPIEGADGRYSYYCTVLIEPRAGGTKGWEDGLHWEYTRNLNG